MRVKYLFFFFLVAFNVNLIGQNNQQKNDYLELITKQKEIIVGERINLEFNTSLSNKLKMFCSNSYGSTVIYSIKKNKKLVFKIPQFLTNKRGVLSWEIYQDNKAIRNGQINLLPSKVSKSLEMYLGPPSIEAGGLDFTMLVTIPTDSLDNPLADNTPLVYKTQFLEKKTSTNLKVKNLITHKNIFSPAKSGRMLISSNHNVKDSKEIDVNIVPAIGEDFKIFVTRNHNYADGNQITTISTSIIRDKNNNIVSDGTFVYFFIKNSNDAVLKTFGKTINGIAKAKMIHPDRESKWRIKGYISGIAESLPLNISYQKAVTDFNIELTNKNRTLTVGPIKSFMNQMIPDGLNVKFHIIQNNKTLKTYSIETNKGYAKFYINKNLITKGIYNFKIETAGLSKTYKNISL
jgi:hypothetical protein